MQPASVGRVLLPFVLLVALLSCVSTQGSMFDSVVEADEGRAAPASDEEGSDGVEQPSDASDTEPGVSIESVPDGASVYDGDDFLGVTPLFFTPEEGEYSLVIGKSGYYTETLEVDYDKGSVHYYEVQLVEITGYLSVDVNVDDAELWVDGERRSGSVVELGVGNHSVRLRAFGFVDETLIVTIREQETTGVVVTLERATQEVSDFALARRVVNPENPGRLGEVGLSFGVTTEGEGVATVRDSGGTTVRSIAIGPFTTWRQSSIWDGRGIDGRAVPDGYYEVSIEVRGIAEEVVESESIGIEVSRGARISFRSGWTGISGMLYSPTSESLPQSSFQVSALGAGAVSASVGRLPLQLFVRLPVVEPFEVAAQTTVIISSAETTPISASLSGRYDLIGSGDARSPVAVSLHAVATYLSRTNADTQTNYTGVRMGATGTVRSGPLRLNAAVELAASPYAVTYSEEDQPIGFHLWSYARGGVMVDLGGFSAGISSALRTLPFSQGLAVQPPFAIGAEAHFLVPNTFFVLSAIAIVEIVSGETYYVSGGGGIGAIY